MATHSSILAWRIPWTGKPGGLWIHRVIKSQTGLKWLSMHACMLLLGIITVKQSSRLEIVTWRFLASKYLFKYHEINDSRSQCSIWYIWLVFLEKPHIKYFILWFLFLICVFSKWISDFRIQNKTHIYLIMTYYFINITSIQTFFIYVNYI